MMDKERAAEFLKGIIGEEETAKVIEEDESQRVQQIADAQIFFDVFGAGRGPELLELFRHKTVYASVMEQTIGELQIPLNPGEFMAMREGQNAFVRWIERMIKLSQEKVE